MDSILFWCYGILAILSYSVLYWSLQPLNRRLKSLPPGPRGLPILGNLLQLGSNPKESLRILARKNGPIMSLFLGTKTVVVVSSSEMAKQVLKTHDRDLAGRDTIESFKVLGHEKGTLIFGQQGAHWKLLRRITTTELFGHKKLTELLHLRRHQLLHTVRQVLEKADGRTCIDVRDVLLTSILSFLGNMIFSTDMFKPDSQRFRDFKNSMAKMVDRAGSPNIVDYFPILKPWDPQHVLRDTEIYMKKNYDILEGFIHNRVKFPHADSTHKDFLDTLIEFTDSNFTLTHIKVLLSDLYGAGTDTSVSTVEWAMAELIRNPAMMAKAQSEVDKVVGNDRIIEENDFEHLPYLRAVVKETLRLHPAVPLLVPHKAEQRCEVAGFVIPRNATVLVNYGAIAKDPCVWSEPEKFMPDRFLDTSVDYKGQNFELIPFGAGRRICVGLPLATIMIHSLLGALIQGFSWRLPHGVEEVDMKENFGLTLHKSSPLIAVAKPRLPTSVYGKE